MHKEHESYGRNDAQFVVTQRKKKYRAGTLCRRGMRSIQCGGASAHSSSVETVLRPFSFER